MNQIMEEKIGDVVINPVINRISTEARQALHKTFQAVNECAAHDDRVTIQRKDLKLVDKLSGVGVRRNY